VRWVVHWGPPSSLEGLYQESGRAGRDGGAARCVVYCGAAELEALRRVEPGKSAGVEAYVSGRGGCRRAALLGHFGEKRTGEGCRGRESGGGRGEEKEGSAEGEREVLCDVCIDPAGVRRMVSAAERASDREIERKVDEMRADAEAAAEDEAARVVEEAEGTELVRSKFPNLASCSTRPNSGGAVVSKAAPLLTMGMGATHGGGTGAGAAAGAGDAVRPPRRMPRLQRAAVTAVGVGAGTTHAGSRAAGGARAPFRSPFRSTQLGSAATTTDAAAPAAVAGLTSVGSTVIAPLRPPPPSAAALKRKFVSPLSGTGGLLEQ